MNVRKQDRFRVGALRPPEQEIGVGRSARAGYTFQVRLEITGDIEVTAIRLLANRKVEATWSGPPPEACAEVICCEAGVNPPES
jgi:hypothetical protein